MQNIISICFIMQVRISNVILEDLQKPLAFISETCTEFLFSHSKLTYIFLTNFILWTCTSRKFDHPLSQSFTSNKNKYPTFACITIAGEKECHGIDHAMCALREQVCKYVLEIGMLCQNSRMAKVYSVVQYDTLVTNC